MLLLLFQWINLLNFQELQSYDYRSAIHKAVPNVKTLDDEPFLVEKVDGKPVLRQPPASHRATKVPEHLKGDWQLVNEGIKAVDVEEEEDNPCMFIIVIRVIKVNLYGRKLHFFPLATGVDFEKCLYHKPKEDWTSILDTNLSHHSRKSFFSFFLSLKMDHLKVISLSQGLSFSHKTDQNNKTILHPDDKFHKFSYG